MNIYPKPTPGATDQRLSVDGTTGGVQLTSSVFNARTDTIILDVQDADCFVTFDGSAPTTSNGHKLYNQRAYTWSKAAAAAAKFIWADGATTATIHATEFTL